MTGSTHMLLAFVSSGTFNQTCYTCIPKTVCLLCPHWRHGRTFAQIETEAVRGNRSYVILGGKAKHTVSFDLQPQSWRKTQGTTRVIFHIGTLLGAKQNTQWQLLEYSRSHHWTFVWVQKLQSMLDLPVTRSSKRLFTPDSALSSSRSSETVNLKPSYGIEPNNCLCSVLVIVSYCNSELFFKMLL